MSPVSLDFDFHKHRDHVWHAFFFPPLSLASQEQNWFPVNVYSIDELVTQKSGSQEVIGLRIHKMPSF